MGKATDPAGKVVQLAADCGQTRIDPLYRRRTLDRLELVRQVGDSLDDVVVQLAREPGPLLLLRGQEPAAEALGRRKKTSLLDDYRRDEGEAKDQANEGRGNEDPPELIRSC